MTSMEIYLLTLLGIIIQFLIIMFAVKAGSNASERTKQLNIQNNLLHLIAKKQGCTNDELEQAYQ